MLGQNVLYRNNGNGTFTDATKEAGLLRGTEQSLAQGEARRDEIEPERDRRASVAKYGGKQQVQEVVGQSSYVSVSDRRLHFGPGAAETVDLGDSLAKWCEGVAYAKAKADQLVTIKEGTGVVSSQKFSKALAD